MAAKLDSFPTILKGKSIEIMGFNITMAQVFIIISTVVLLIAFTLFINKTQHRHGHAFLLAGYGSG